MPKLRIIPRLDIKSSCLIKSIRLEGLRKLGQPSDFAKRYYASSADELLFYDCVASLYGRNNLLQIIEQTAAEIFIPLTVGGGIVSIDEAQKSFPRSGADKITINSGAIKNKYLISELANKFGSQAIVVEIQAQKTVITPGKHCMRMVESIQALMLLNGQKRRKNWALVKFCSLQ